MICVDTQAANLDKHQDCLLQICRGSVGQREETVPVYLALAGHLSSQHSAVVINTTDTMKMQDLRLSERKKTVGLQVSKNNFKIFFIFLVFRQRLSTEGIPVSLTIQVFLSSNCRSPYLVMS